jgi:hypothetical protein
VDLKTLLLLGAGMLVLALVAFCSVQSRSAGLTGGRLRAPLLAAAGGPMAGAQIDASYLIKGKIPAAPVGANR